MKRYEVQTPAGHTVKVTDDDGAFPNPKRVYEVEGSAVLVGVGPWFIAGSQIVMWRELGEAESAFFEPRPIEESEA